MQGIKSRIKQSTFILTLIFIIIFSGVNVHATGKLRVKEMKTWGTSSDDVLHASTGITDSGEHYSIVVGESAGNFYIAKIDSNNDVVEEWNLGTSGTDVFKGVTKTLNGDILACGFSNGDLEEVASVYYPLSQPQNPGGYMGVFALFDSDLNLLRLSAFGGEGDDCVYYISDPDMNGDMYFVGSSTGDIDTGSELLENKGGKDIIAGKINDFAEIDLLKMYGNVYDQELYAITGGSVEEKIAVGYTVGDANFTNTPSSNGRDFLVLVFEDTDMSIISRKAFGTSGDDVLNLVDAYQVAGEQWATVGGYSDGNLTPLGGNAGAGGYDAVAFELDELLTRQNTFQKGTEGSDFFNYVSFYGGNIYATGTLNGQFYIENQAESKYRVFGGTGIDHLTLGSRFGATTSDFSSTDIPEIKNLTITNKGGYDFVALKIENNSKPVVTITNPIENKIVYKNGNGNKIIISGTVADGDNDQVVVSATIGGVKKTYTVLNPGTDNTFTLEWEVDADKDNIALGTYTNIMVTAEDSMEETGTKTITNNIVVVTAASIGLTIGSTEVITDAITNLTTIHYTFTFAEAVTDFIADMIEVTNGTKGTFSGSGTSYTLEVTYVSEGAQIVSVPLDSTKTTDGNKNAAASLTNTIDTVAPTITVSVSDDAISSKRKNMTITTTDGTGSGLVVGTVYQYQLGTSNTEVPTGSWKAYVSGTEEVIGSGITGTRYIWVKKVVDKAGNSSVENVTDYTVSGALEFDNTAPDISMSDPEEDERDIPITRGNIVLSANEAVIPGGGTIVIACYRAYIHGRENDASHVDFEAVALSEYIQGTGNNIEITIPISAFLSGGNALTLQNNMEYQISLESEAFMDVAGNSNTPNILGRFYTSFDAKAPTVTFTPNGQSAYTRNIAAGVNIAISDDPLSVEENACTGIDFSKTKYIWVQGSGIPTDGDFNAGTAISSASTTVVTPNGTGDYYLWVRSVDNVENSEDISSNVFRFDNTVPVITITPDNSTATKTKSVTITATDVGSGLALSNEYTYQLGDSATEAPTGSWSPYVSGIPFTVGDSITGIKYIWVKTIADAAGNTSTENVAGYTVSGAFVFDNTAPVIAITPNGDNTPSKIKEVTIAVTEVGTGLAAGNEYQYQWGTSNTEEPLGEWSNYSSTGTTEINFGSTVTGTRYLWIKTISDNAGNSSLENIPGYMVSEAFVLDNTAPVITITPDNSTATKTKSVTITATDVGSGLALSNEYTYQLGDSATEAPSGSWSPYVSGTPFTIGSGITGTKYIWVKTIADAAGNTSTENVAGYTVSGTFVFDNTIPTISNVTISSNHTPSAYAINGKTITLTFESSETITAPTVTIAGKTASVTNTGNNWTATYLVGSGVTEGPVAISISGYADMVGNNGDTHTNIDSGSVIVDTIAPIISSIMPSGTGVPTSTFNIVFTISENITAGAGRVQIEVDSATYTASITGADISGSTLTVPVSRFSGGFTLAYNKTYYVNVEASLFKDIAGNTNVATTGHVGTRTFETSVDITPPTVIFTPNTQTTPVQQIGVWMEAQDVSGIGAAMNPFVDYVWTTNATIAEGSLEAFVNNPEYTDSPSGATGDYYLWVTATDNAGNTGWSRSGVYKLDNTAPTAKLTTPTGNSLATPGTTVNPEGLTNLVLTFDETVTVNTGSISVIETTSQGSKTYTTTVTGAQLSGSGASTTLTVPVTSFKDGSNATLKMSYNAHYEVRMGGSAFKDIAGNGNDAGVVDSFDTLVDITAPTVTFAPDTQTTPVKSIDVYVTMEDEVGGSGLDSIGFTSAYIWNTDPDSHDSGTKYFIHSGNQTISSPFIGVTGDYYLWVYAIDKAGNGGWTRSGVYKLDNTSPTITDIRIVSNNTTNTAYASAGNTITVYLDANEALQAPSMTILGKTATVSQVGDASHFKGEVSVVSGDTQGVISFSITNIKDTAGNAVAGSRTATTDASSVTVDTIKPVMSSIVLSSSVTATGPVTYTITVTDASAITADIDKVNIVPQGIGNAVCGSKTLNVSGNVVTLTLSSLSGTGELKPVFDAGFIIDAAGNLSDADSTTADNVEVDNDALGVTISYLPTGGNYKGGITLEIIATFNKGIKSSPNPKITLSGVVDLPATNLTKDLSDMTDTIYTYEYNVPAGIDGAVNVSISNAESLLGKLLVGGTNAGNFRIDNTRPTITISPNSSTATNEKEITITVSDSGSGLSTANVYQYQLGDSATEAPTGSWSPYTSGTAFTIGSGVDGTKYVWVKKVADKAGNTSIEDIEGYTVSDAFVFDNAEPIITMHSPARQEVGVAIDLSNIVLSASETVTAGMGNIYVQSGAYIYPAAIQSSYISGSGADTKITIPVSDFGFMTWPIWNNLILGYNGTYYVGWDDGAFLDAAGNYPNTFLIDQMDNWFKTIEDHAGPTALFDPNGQIFAIKTVAGEVEVTISDAVSGLQLDACKYLWSTSSTQPAYTVFASSGSRFASRTILIPTPVATGEYYLWLWLYDNAGNQSYIRSNVFKLDNSGPSVSYDTPPNSTAVKSMDVDVTIIDTLSQIHNTSRYKWTTDTRMPTSSDFSVMGDPRIDLLSAIITMGGRKVETSISTPEGVTGSYYLWIKAADSLGNESYTKAGPYLLDNTGPSISNVLMTSAPGNSSGSYAKLNDVITLTFGANKDLQTPNVKIYSSMGAELTGAVTVAQDGDLSHWKASVQVEVGDAEGLVSFEISNLKDLAGNTSANITTLSSGVAVTIDKTAGGVVFSTTGNKWIGSVTKINAKVSDALSGVKSLGGGNYVVSYAFTDSTLLAEGSAQFIPVSGGAIVGSSGLTLENFTLLNGATSGAEDQYLQLRIEDTAGNITVLKSAAFKLDLDPPDAPTFNYMGYSTPVNADLTIRITAGSDNVTSLGNMRVKYAVSNSLSYSGPYTTSTSNEVDVDLSEGRHYIHAISIDEAGNESSQATSSLIVIDKTAPIVSITREVTATEVIYTLSFSKDVQTQAGASVLLNGMEEIATVVRVSNTEYTITKNISTIRGDDKIEVSAAAFKDTSNNGNVYTEKTFQNNDKTPGKTIDDLLKEIEERVKNLDNLPDNEKEKEIDKIVGLIEIVGDMTLTPDQKTRLENASNSLLEKSMKYIGRMYVVTEEKSIVTIVPKVTNIRYVLEEIVRVENVLIKIKGQSVLKNNKTALVKVPVVKKEMTFENKKEYIELIQKHGLNVRLEQGSGSWYISSGVLDTPKGIGQYELVLQKIDAATDLGNTLKQVNDMIRIKLYYVESGVRSIAGSNLIKPIELEVPISTTKDVKVYKVLSVGHTEEVKSTISGGIASFKAIEVGSYVFAVSTEFKDIDDHWAEEYIKELQDRGITEGSEDGVFDPDGEITRAQAGVFVARTLKLSPVAYTTKYKDISDGKWYTDDVLSASSKGLLLGYTDGTFRPNVKLSRTEMTAIMMRVYELLMKEDLSKIAATVTEDFADFKDVGNWAKTYVKAAKGAGIVEGVGKNKFEPNRIVTRAELAKIIVEILRRSEQ